MHLEKIKHLEGLRGLAALLVFFYHIKLLFYVNTFEAIDQSTQQSFLHTYLKTYLIELKNTFTDGTLFVWVFWILSAYVLSIKLFRNTNDASKIVLGSFLKRYIRLFVPIAFSVLLALALKQSNLFFNDEASKTMGAIGYDSHWISGFYNFQFDLSNFLNFIFYGIYLDYYQFDSYNSVLWSIQTEFIGSLFIFATYGVLKTNKNRAYIYLILCFVLLYMNLYHYLPFIIGYLLCDMDHSALHHTLVLKLKAFELKLFKYKWLTLLAFFILLIVAKIALQFCKGDIAYAYILQSFLILYFSIKNPLIKSFLSLKWIYKFGTISFSFYLIHMIVICSFSSFLITKGLGTEFKVLNVVLTLVLSILLSIPYYLYIDKFAIVVSRKFAGLFLRKQT